MSQESTLEPMARTLAYRLKLLAASASAADVRFGSKADISDHDPTCTYCRSVAEDVLFSLRIGAKLLI